MQWVIRKLVGVATAKYDDEPDNSIRLYEYRLKKYPWWADPYWHYRSVARKVKRYCSKGKAEQAALMLAAKDPTLTGALEVEVWEPPKKGVAKW
jgi:hypothetical protein